MATLALAAVGSAVGGSLLPAGFGVFGTTLTGATIGSQLGALAGSYVDNALFGSSGQNRTVEGPRLSDLHVTSSTEGSPIPRLYGRARLGGQIIWATDFEEEVVTNSQSAGGSKGGLGGSGPVTTTTEYRYYANFAVALCEGVVTRIGRIWADGREIDASRYSWRLHPGSESQSVDSLIAAREGAGRAPAYRGTAYVVFERLALAEFGNRVPQLSFEVYRNIEAGDADIKGVVLIPGSGEFVYASEPVRKIFAPGVAEAENVHTLQAATDWEAAIDQLQAELPNAKHVSLVVSWFGSDLRAGSCQLRPGIDDPAKVTAPLTWNVAGQDRASAYRVSLVEDRAAYGGTPSDQTVISAIRDLKARGINVTLTPFILMDIAAGNVLPNPYGGASQPAYPWRGRITCHPAPSGSATSDKTSAAEAQISAFVGTATPSHFALDGDRVIYTGPAEWSFRRMVLHYAHLVKAAGGVEAFVIGTEMRGLTCVRNASGGFPFVSALIGLANDVKSILGSTKVLYAADWSEYFGYHPVDGSGDVLFHLDPLWASSSIDAIGIDVYWPLADWREGRSHFDYQAGFRSTYDLNYLKSNVQGGEGFHWYYATDADRINQIRTPITDGQGKPWVFRYKDIKSWWLNLHYNRLGGIESATPTAWLPQSKPFWFMEVGCPAVNKGANQPNVFVDPKSIENALPYFSTGVRDDLVQRRFLKAFIQAFDPGKPGYIAGANPVSTLTGASMVNLNHIHCYCWDARPYPAFPNAIDVWGDGTNWQLGHWINGRLGTAPLAELVAAILSDYQFADHETGSLNGSVPGFVIDRIMSARDALQPLELAYFFDSIESGGKIAFRHRGQDAIAASLTDADLVETRAGDTLMSLTRGQETELPASAKLRFISADDDYRQALAEARRLTGASGRVAQADLPIVLDEQLSSGIAESWLFESWAARERASFRLPPSQLALEPGDLVTYAKQGRSRTLRITDVSDHGVREIEARSIDLDVYGRVSAPVRPARVPTPVQIGPPDAVLLDLPLIDETADARSGYAAAVQTPWPGDVAVYASAQSTGFALRGLISAAASMGRILDAMVPGPEGRIDWAAHVRVRLSRGSLTSVDRVGLLSGANLAAVQTASGGWEVIQFENAMLVDVGTYRLSGLLRGQFGTEAEMSEGVALGATFVLLDAAVTRIGLGLSDLNLPLNWRYGPGNRNIGDESYGMVQHAFRGLGLRPLSPAHIKGVRNGAGDLCLSWVRRTRLGGDSWEVSDVPIGEDSERYEIDIFQGISVKRTLTATTPTIVYSAAEQIADFGAPQAILSVRVCQLSSIVGRGMTRSVSV